MVAKLAHHGEGGDYYPIQRTLPTHQFETWIWPSQEGDLSTLVFLLI
jgi:hypothetical protein